MADTSANPFLQNKFMPQAAPYNGANGMPQASWMPPNMTGMGQSYGGGFGNGDLSKGQIAGGMATGLGNYLSGLAQNNLQQQGQEISGSSALMNGINNQQQMAQQGSQAAMPYVQPQNSVIPFEKMALSRALANAGAPSDVNPGGYMGKFIPNTSNSNSNQWKALQDTTNQYFSDPAIENSMAQYNKQLLNVDPYAQPQNMAAIFGNNGQPTDATNAAQDDLTKWQQNAQGRRADFNNQATQALQQALKNNQGGGSIWGKILGGITSVAPYALAAM